MVELNDKIIKVGFFVAFIGILFPPYNSLPIFSILGALIAIARVLVIGKDIILKYGLAVSLLGFILFLIGVDNPYTNMTMQLGAFTVYLGGGLIVFRRYLRGEKKILFSVSVVLINAPVLFLIFTKTIFFVHTLIGLLLGLLINLINLRYEETKQA